MQINELFASNLGGVTSTTPTTTSEASNTLDNDDFLTLLVTQLQNQDPLNPMDSTEFSAQLAQFSSLEQLIQINEGIDSLGSGSGSGQIDALSLLGQQVRAASGEIEVASGEHSELSFELATGGAVEVEISSGGVSLGTFALGGRGAGAHALDLSDLDGAPPLADGTYSVTVRSIGDGGLTEDVPTFVLGQVTGVDLADGDPALLLGTRRIDMGEVREVRAGGTSPDTSEPSTETEGESSDA